MITPRIVKKAMAAIHAPEAGVEEHEMRLALNAVLPDILSDWRPIETAPKDGTRILGWVVPDQWSPNGYAYVVRWEQYQRPGHDGQMGAWTEAAGEGYATFRLSHWMPVPAPPLAPDTASAD